MKRNIKSPIGTELTCKNWLIEAAYRMIQNNLDADVAFDPENLIVYGGRGKAARNWESFDKIPESYQTIPNFAPLSRVRHRRLDFRGQTPRQRQDCFESFDTRLR